MEVGVSFFLFYNAEDQTSGHTYTRQVLCHRAATAELSGHLRDEGERAEKQPHGHPISPRVPPSASLNRTQWETPG